MEHMSDSVPEPTGVGPLAGGNLRASDADRDQVTAVLSTAYAEGRITREEHDERLDQVMRAKTFDDLVPITSDLVPLSAVPVQPLATNPVPAPVEVSTTQFQIDTSRDSGSDQLIAIFGGASRKGRWRMPKQSTAIALFGGIDLDLTEATFESTEIEITGFWCFGGMDIKAPAGIEVRDRTAGIFGGTDIKGLGDPVPGAPVITIKGVSLFGGVSVAGPIPSKRKRNRRRHELH
ncbi:hypothetical protein MLP_05460 [Microlunatus phosphovorus NM-1]|uniref:DUF1707 domain-containing protein n=2 Tax=Microlunatus phosphovorus TaxID=29405 RepID=F5XK64_MICPN|nr:hypothetical protein MLP_05460 [Microlunatus phosphovorus NM-1]